MWTVVEIVENVRVKSESRVADACLRNWHRTVVDHPVQHVADAGRGADGLGPLILAAVFRLYARFVFAQVEPPIGGRSRPLGRILDVVHEIRLGASFEEQWPLVFERRECDVGPLLNQMLTELMQDSTHLFGLEAN